MAKVERSLFFLLIILLPSQLGYHFWPDWSLVNGIRVDYLSPTVYLTDVLIFFLWVFNSPPSPLFSKERGARGVSYFKLGLSIFITSNILFSISPLVSLYKWLRVYEYYWLFKYLTLKIDLKLKIENLKFAVLWTSGLAWAQLLLQRSVGGLFYWLGERAFSITTPGIAKVFLGLGNWDLGFVLRPYATLPHPNALAGWLLVVGLLLGGWPQVVSWITVLLTFSRSAILLLPLYFWRRSKVLTMGLLIIGYWLLIGMGNPTSLSERTALSLRAIEVVIHSPWLGVGLGNFVYQVPDIRQPVHNIYLLLASELGLPALIYLSFVVIRSLGHWLRIVNWDLRFAVLVVAATGLVDHYWLTLHQNTLLLVVLLTLIKVQSMATNDNV